MAKPGQNKNRGRSKGGTRIGEVNNPGGGAYLVRLICVVVARVLGRCGLNVAFVVSSASFLGLPCNPANSSNQTPFCPPRGGPSASPEMLASGEACLRALTTPI